MAYTSLYTQADLSTLIVDMIGWAFVTIVDNMGLLVLLVVLGLIVMMSRGVIGSLFSMIHFK